VVALSVELGVTAWQARSKAPSRADVSSCGPDWTASAPRPKAARLRIGIGAAS